jgi:hypothetical protein
VLDSLFAIWALMADNPLISLPAMLLFVAGLTTWVAHCTSKYARPSATAVRAAQAGAADVSAAGS